MSIVQSLLGGAIEAAVRSAFASGMPLDPKLVSDAATATLGNDPAVVNQLNAEPLHRSRVVVGSTVGLVMTVAAAGMHLYEMWQSGTIDVALASAELAAIWGVLFTLYGRLKGGLEPLSWGARRR